MIVAAMAMLRVRLGVGGVIAREWFVLRIARGRKVRASQGRMVDNVDRPRG